jgi:cytochrome P450
MQEILSPDPILALARPEVLADPYPAYAWLREHTPVLWYEPLGSWILTRYADCVEVLRDNVRFGADWRRIGEDLPPHVLSVQTLDPPEHTTIRRLLMEAMHGQDDAATMRTIADHTTHLLDRLSGLPSFDFVTEFAEPLALSTIAAYLGVSAPDRDWFVPASNAIADGMDASLWPERAAAASAARIRLAELTDGWLADPPNTGVVARIAGLCRSGEVDRDVVANTLRVLVHAGYASASKLLSLAAVVLLAEPGWLARWALADPALAVDELIRFVSPVQAVARACVVSTQLGDVPVRAGHAVTLLVGAANRDPERFGDPDVLCFARRAGSHLGFGRGSHSCLGSPLAVAQVKTVFTALARDYPAVHMAGTPSYRTNLTLRGLEQLPVALR